MAVAKYPEQRALAETWGAEAVWADAEVGDSVRESVGPAGADCVIDTVSTAEAFDLALSVVRKAGRVALVGGYSGPLNVNLGPIVGKEIELTGSGCYAYSGLKTDFEHAMDLMQHLQFERIVTHRFPLAQAVEAFETAADKSTGSLKVHFVG